MDSRIEYNKTFRCGRLLYVDGIRVYNGCMKEEYLEEYGELCNQFIQQLGDIKNNLLRKEYSMLKPNANKCI